MSLVLTFVAFNVDLTTALIAAAVSVGTTFATKLWLDRHAHRQQLEADYEYEQRKSLLGLIGRHHGSLLDRATSWHYRMANIYANHDEGWLAVNGDYARPAYYFRSTVHRFLGLQAQAQLFENEQIFIDARVVQERDRDFVKFVKALHWVMSDVALFDGVAYDKDKGPDHFTSDSLRTLSEAFLIEGRVPSFRAFEARLNSESDGGELTLVLEFFDGISRAEARLRWDRIVCLHLLTIALARAFGYDWLRPSHADVENAVSQIRSPTIAGNLASWLPRLGLAEHGELVDVRDALEKKAATSE